VIRDISGELAQLRAEEAFFADASHEVRTPAATIKASAEVLADALTSQLPESLRRVVLNIVEEAERLDKLVDDLLDFERIRTARAQPRIARHDLREVVRRALDSMRPLARQHEQSLSLVMPDQPVYAAVDAELLERVIVNLVVNAVKYGPRRGRVEVTLEVFGETPSQVVFGVRDDGPGVPVDDLERIFDRFYRLPRDVARRIQGSGLGLPMCRAAVELHGGRVWVEPRPEGGSLFKVALPLRATPTTDGGPRCGSS
jgi:signal transduction histidine kinase